MTWLSDIADQLEEGGIGDPVPASSEPPKPPGDHGLLVQIVKLRNANYSGREAHGILPVFVVGHQNMSEDAWSGWVRAIGTGAYGPAYAERCVKEGIDLKEMTPTAPFGRAMRLTEGPRSPMGRRYLDQAAYILNVVEKWPNLYNLIAHEMGGMRMSLAEFVNRVSSLPSPHEVGEGQHSTLGDLIGRGMMLLPDY